jgi:Immunity protein Imm1
MQPLDVLEEVWSQGRRKEEESQAEEPQQLVEAIGRLDGVTRDLLIFALPSSSLSIGGGRDGIYVAHFAVGVDDAFYNLVNPNASRERLINVRVGGQLGAYSARQCVDREAVTTAALYFAEHGDMSSQLHWEKEP